ncbi:MAG TPA: hypothetical protein VJ943_15275 [Desulfotignum sp.]|nr:hypothetical protein [Desulfotignum sp.]
MPMNMFTNMTMPIPMTAKPMRIPTAIPIPIPMAMNTITATHQVMLDMITRKRVAVITMIIPDMKQSPIPIPMIDRSW